MDQNIISFVVIIICLVLAYGIINYKYNKRIIKTLESFQSKYQITNDEQFKKGLINNTEFMKEFANGTWTYLTSSVDSNYNLDYIMNITINPNQQTTVNNNYGTITVTNTSTNEAILTFTITSFINNILTANVVSLDDSNPNLITPTGTMVTSIFIQFINKLNETALNDVNKETYYSTEAPVAIVSLYNQDTMIIKYASYKVYNNTVGNNVYKILISKSFYANPLPIYNYRAYNIITTSYKYPTNYLSLSFGTLNQTVQTILENNYFSKIQFAIQRVFESPTGNEIKSILSPPILLDALQAGNIPTEINIVPVLQDKKINKLENFFEPISTIVYFYKYQDVNTTYGYQNNNLINVPNTVMNLRNNSNSMFGNNIQYENLNTVYQNNDYIFDIQYLTTVNCNMNDKITIPFSTLIPLL